ncbi:hypothetical protein RUND412_002080 [Rhizina undulata]
MSGFSSRVNMSLYLANFNAIPTADEPDVDTFNPNDLAFFTNTRFFDFDVGQPVDDFMAGYDLENDGALDCSLGDDLDFLNDCDPFADYTQFSPTTDDNHQQHLVSPTNTLLHSAPITMIPRHTLAPDTATIVLPPLNATISPSTDIYASQNAESTSHFKRKTSSPPFDVASPGLSADNIEEASRNAAEEDKRRRNTAASARFRVKKKQREQILERTSKEMTERCAKLEQRVNQLEMENKWLKNLIIEKNNGGSSKTTIESLNEMFKAKYATTIATTREKGADSRNGTGTK